MPRPKRVTLTLQTPALNNVCADQTTAGAGDFLINGSLASSSVVSIPTAQKLDLESAGNVSATNFVIVGTGNDGQAISETIAGPNANTVTTTNYFKTITSITVDGAIGTNTSIGISDEALSQTIPLNRYATLGYTIGVDISGTINFTGQLTASQVQNSSITPAWAAVSALTTKTADTVAEITSPYSAFRLVVNSYTAAATAAIDINQS